MPHHRHHGRADHRGHVKVFVANASGKKGAAGTVAHVLTDQGFPAPTTGNAAQTTNIRDLRAAG